METLKVDGGDVENLTNWKVKQLLKNVVLGTLVPFQMNMLYFMYGITNPSLWWDLTYESTSKLLTSMKDEATKQLESDEKIIQPTAVVSTSTNPKLSKNARKV
jgi:hypothetical protein